MKTQLKNQIMMSLLVLVAFLALGLSAFSASPEAGFKMLKQKNGVDLYYRWMTMPEGNEVRQMKAVLEVNGTPEDIVSLLKDENRALDWLPSAEQFRNLTPVNGPEWASYIQFATPWPFADQDCILRYEVKSCTPEETRLDFMVDPEYISKVEGVTRMKDIVGSFVIKPLPNGHSEVECYFLSTKASKIPRWISDPIISGSILSLMESLKRELNEV
jgi:hypothetical protein